MDIVYGKQFRAIFLHSYTMNRRKHDFCESSGRDTFLGKFDYNEDENFIVCRFSRRNDIFGKLLIGLCYAFMCQPTRIEF